MIDIIKMPADARLEFLLNNPPPGAFGASSTEGVKHDQGKPRMDLIPQEAMAALGSALHYGANKYGEHNWIKGMDWHRVYGAALRHLTSFWAREDDDPESGLNHLNHALANIAFLITYYERGLGKDDRPPQ